MGQLEYDLLVVAPSSCLAHFYMTKSKVKNNCQVALLGKYSTFMSNYEQGKRLKGYKQVESIKGEEDG